MCGIAGLIDLSHTMDGSALARQIDAMSATLVHRGPDMGAKWVDRDAGIAIGFRRLSIVDLTEAGAQPMVSASGQSIICYNGEVYNKDELTSILGGRAPRYRGHSDTEVLLETCDLAGVREALGAAIGMFAVSIWNRRNQRLTLARDRLGIKPLYWLHRPGKVFAFASELQALRTIPDLEWTIDHQALVDYLRVAYVPGPRTIFANVQQLLPGHCLTLAPDATPRLEQFWSLAQTVECAKDNPFQGDENDARAQLESLLHDAVGRRLVADVPLGAFLSGGIDSSTVAAIMQANTSQPIRTFSIGFHEDGYNEADDADRVAAHLGTDHTRFDITARDALGVIDRLPRVYDQPFADSSQIPTYLISRLAREEVTVALTGDGGDEVFAGYNRHRQAKMIERMYDRVPRFSRRLLAQLVRALSPDTWERIAGVLPRNLKPQHAGEKLYKLAGLMACEPGQAYRTLTDLWHSPDRLVNHDYRQQPGAWWEADQPDLPDMLSRFQFADTVDYLPGDCLTKVDRASMATSLEVRVPLLDHRIVAFAWSLPTSYKIRADGGKWLLRQVLYKYVPKQLFDRPKMGFGVPIDAWLRNDLRDWAEDLLAPHSLELRGLNPAPIREAWRSHISGRENRQYEIWTILMFQAWMQSAGQRVCTAA